MSPVQKRSVRIAGHSTSITLEPEFWDELKAIAAARGLSLNQLIASIDTKRAGNLSSTLRVFVLGQLKLNALGRRAE
jgi:hypothetical protein